MDTRQQEKENQYELFTRHIETAGNEMIDTHSDTDEISKQAVRDVCALHLPQSIYEFCIVYMCVYTNVCDVYLPLLHVSFEAEDNRTAAS